MASSGFSVKETTSITVIARGDLYVAVTGGRHAWRDAKGHPFCIGADCRRACHHVCEGVRILDPVVGRHDQKNVLRPACKGCEINRRRRVAAGLLKDELGCNARIFSGLMTEKPVLLAGNDERRAASLIRLARESVREKRLPITGKSMNCFGRDFRLEGHSRVPDPPDRITGLILIMSPEPEARSIETTKPARWTKRRTEQS